MKRKYAEKSNDVTWEDNTKDLETKFDASYDVLYRPLPRPKITKLFRLMEHELGEKIMTVFVVLEPKM